MKKLLIAFLLILGTTSGAQAGADNILQAGAGWTNQSGSTFYIDSIAGNGLITGTYINRAAGTNCQNISYPVTGWYYPGSTTSSMTFTTIWQSNTTSCSSITAWTGFFNGSQIQTLWQLVVNGSTSTGQIIQGADTFTPDGSNTHKTLLAK
jgi:hypothetical protein